ncbi:hypothetical protein CEXT_510391 [Caerostris extrusa]|uniref:Uncharacterized protein n=1 Tax=Caerostris extrusa TaxID=172846 RepID=A0AAV4WWB2_CAEEX|nr:hypothetical protein CEXT_510391 [Caerostris extrusa]
MLWPARSPCIIANSLEEADHYSFRNTRVNNTALNLPERGRSCKSLFLLQTISDPPSLKDRESSQPPPPHRLLVYPPLLA